MTRGEGAGNSTGGATGTAGSGAGGTSGAVTGTAGASTATRPDDRDPHERGEVRVAQRAGDRLGRCVRAASGSAGRRGVAVRGHHRIRRIAGAVGRSPARDAGREPARLAVGSRRARAPSRATRARPAAPPGRRPGTRSRRTATSRSARPLSAPAPASRPSGPPARPARRPPHPARLVRCGLGDDRERRGLPRTARLGARHPGGAPPRGVADLDAARAASPAGSRRGGSGPPRPRARPAPRRRPGGARPGRTAPGRTGRPPGRSGRRTRSADRPGTFAAGSPMRPARSACGAGGAHRRTPPRRAGQNDQPRTRIHGGHRRFTPCPPGRCEHAPPHVFTRPETGRRDARGAHRAAVARRGDRSTRSGVNHLWRTGVFALVNTDVKTGHRKGDVM